MSARGLESALARLYTDPDHLKAFLADPGAALADSDLDARERASLEAADKAGLIMAARSFRAKREGHAKRRSGGLVARIFRRIRLSLPGTGK